MVNKSEYLLLSAHILNLLLLNNVPLVQYLHCDIVSCVYIQTQDYVLHNIAISLFHYNWYYKA